MVVIGVVVQVAPDPEPQLTLRVDVADLGPDPTATPTTPPTTAEPGPNVEGFPVSLRIDRTEFRPGDGGLAELGFVPTGDTHERVTVAIPFTLEAREPAASPGSYDLYDMSRSSEPYWQPHGTGPAWYEWTAGAWGFPIRLPVEGIAAGPYRVCVQAWHSSDGPPLVAESAPPPGPDGTPVERAGDDAATLPDLAIPPAAVRLCTTIEVVAP